MLSKLTSSFIKSSYWKDIAWVVSGNTLVQAISILILPVLTRLYAPEDFALQALFLQATAFIAVIITLRYEYLIQLPNNDNEAKWIIKLVIILSILWGGLLYPLLWVFRTNIALLLGEVALAPWLLLVPISASLMSLSIAYQNYTQRKRKYRESSFSEIINKGVSVSTSLTGYSLLPGPGGLIIAPALGAIAKILYLAQPWKKTQNNTGDLNKIKALAKKYSRLSGALVLSHLMAAITTILPSIYIAKHYGSHTLGQYALVMSTIFFPSGLLGNAIGQVYYQRAAESWGQGKSFSRLWATTAKKLLLFGLPIYIILFFFSPLIYPFFFGTKWTQAGEFASIIAVAGFFSFTTSPLDRACLVVNAWWYAPTWHTLRVITILLVLWVANFFAFDMRSFLLLLVFQMSALYLLDYWAEWHFSNRHPHPK